MTWEQMHETMAFLLASQASHDAQIEKLIENQAKLQDSMREWHEDRQQMNKTMLNLIERQNATFERLDKMESAAEQRSKEADARMTRLEKLFERSITRGQNGN
jgi:ferritin-like metal-binding protein YciE